MVACEILCGVLLPTRQTVSVEKSAQPNIVVILVDDQYDWSQPRLTNY